MIKPENSNGLMQLWCDNSLDPGGWTVIQKRTDGSVNFFRNWENYKVSEGRQMQADLTGQSTDHAVKHNYPYDSHCLEKGLYPSLAVQLVKM